MKLIFTAVLLLPLSALCQVQQGTPTPPPSSTPPPVTPIQKAAIDHLRDLVTQAQTLFNIIDTDYRKQNPGYYISPVTYQPEAIPAPAPQPKPEVNKK